MNVVEFAKWCLDRGVKARFGLAQCEFVVKLVDLSTGCVLSFGRAFTVELAALEAMQKLEPWGMN